MKKPLFVAEVKTHSPFGWRSEKTWEELFDIANHYGDMLSIHTDPRWHGSFDLVRRARKKTTKPILAKGVHAYDGDIARALGAGADYVLVVGRVPGVHLDSCWLEPTTLTELLSYPTELKAVWNARDLETGGSKGVSFTDIRKQYPGWLCQASHIKVPKDVSPSADAYIVGTFLPEFVSLL